MEGISGLSHFAVLRGWRAGGDDYWGLTGFRGLKGTRARTSFCRILSDSVDCELGAWWIVDWGLGIAGRNMCGVSPWVVVSYFV